MIYRKEKQKEMSKVERQQPNISKLMGARWRALTPNERLVYEIKAAEADIEHKLKFPGYVFSPKRMSAEEKEKLKLLKKGKKKAKKAAEKGKVRNILSTAGGSRALFVPDCDPQLGGIVFQVYQPYVEPSTSFGPNTQQVVRSLAHSSSLDTSLAPSTHSQIESDTIQGGEGYQVPNQSEITTAWQMSSSVSASSSMEFIANGSNRSFCQPEPQWMEPSFGSSGATQLPLYDYYNTDFRYGGQAWQHQEVPEGTPETSHYYNMELNQHPEVDTPSEVSLGNLEDDCPGLRVVPEFSNSWVTNPRTYMELPDVEDVPTRLQDSSPNSRDMPQPHADHLQQEDFVEPWLYDLGLGLAPPVNASFNISTVGQAQMDYFSHENILNGF
ncbi:hypothetical protein BDQ17DRAFT_1491289 [Cyathus striatus]|nr:hypothetical protein BDQ17DRAFT_1491289 [Cyathus striatus]